MTTFQPSFSLWPRPQFLGASPDSLAAWLDGRDRHRTEEAVTRLTASIRQIVEDHHDEHARTISARRQHLA